MASRESGGPRPENKAPAPAEKKPAETKDTKAPDAKPAAAEASQKVDHSPAEHRIKSEERIIDPSGKVTIKKEYYDTIPETPSATEAAKAKAAEGTKDGDKDKGKEDGKEKPVTGDDVVKDVVKDPDAPKDMKKAVEGHDHGAAKAVENTKVGGTKVSKLWEKVKPALGGFLAGAAARSGIRFFARRALDATSFGASVAAGGIVGGGMEYYKANKAENKRLYDMKTYDGALSDYDLMQTDLERVTALVAVEDALKTNIKGKNLTPTQRVEYQARLVYLKIEIEKIKVPARGKKNGVDTVKELLKFRTKEEAEKLKVTDRLKMFINHRSRADRENLNGAQSSEVKRLLEEFQKERGLKKDGWKIARSTLYGTAVGMAGGALGEWALDHAGHFAADKGLIPESWGFHVGSSSGGYGLHNPAEAAHVTRELAEQAKTSFNITELLKGGGIEAAAIGGVSVAVGVAGYKAFRPKESAPEEPENEDLILSDTETKGFTLKRRLEVLNDNIRADAKRRIENGAKYLEGNRPNLAMYKREWAALDVILGQKQFENLVNGASNASIDRIGSAWAQMTNELKKLANSIEARAADISANQTEADQPEAMDDDGDDGEDTVSSESPKRPNNVEQVGDDVSKKLEEQGRRFNNSITQAEIALGLDNIAIAEDKHSDAVLAITALSTLAMDLKGLGQKFTIEKIEALQKKADNVNDRIQKLKASKRVVNPVPEEAGQVKTEKNEEATKLGLLEWQLPFYHKMIELKLMTKQPDGVNLSDQKNKNSERLTKFILLTQGQNNSFETLTKGGAEKLKTRFLTSLDSLKNSNNPEPLKKLCLEILTKGNTYNKKNFAEKILSDMKALGTEVELVVTQARSEFKPKKTQTK